MTMTDAELADLWDTPTEVPDPTQEYRYFSPLVNAADDYIAQARTLGTGERIYTGIDVFDEAMRGLAPRELMVVQGFAHSGKTLFTTEMIRNNADRRIILFTADEDRVLTLAKLTSLVTGISAETLEIQLSNGDEEAEQLVRTIASKHFPNLAVFDDINDLRTMSKAMAEAEHHWDARVELVIFDYMDLLSVADGGEGNMPAKFNAIKSWGKRHAVPLIALHQASRSKGADGAEMTLVSGAYGGEQQATFLVGVRRKRSMYKGLIVEINEKLATQTNPSDALREKLVEAEYELGIHQNTVTFNLVKNKRPPSRLVDDTDFTLDADTGRISPYTGTAMHSRTSQLGGRTTGAQLMKQRQLQIPVPSAHVPMSNFEEDF